MAEGALEFYCGSLGSGKTSFAFERGLDHMLKGGTVVTNIEVYRDRIAEWFARRGWEFDQERLITVQDGPDVWQKAVTGSDDLATMLILDEAHVEHNARDWGKSSSGQLLFNTMARKLKIHVIYVTQDLNNVDKQFRRMAQVVWYCRNARHASFFGGLFHFPFNLFFRVPYLCGPGVQPKPQSPEVCFRPTSWGLFNSHSLVGKAAETFASLKSAKTAPLKRIPPPKEPFFWPYLLAPVVSLAIFL